MVAAELTLTPSSAAVAGALVELGERATDLREPFGEIAQDLSTAQAARFGSTVASWPPLSPAYAARKALEYPGRPTLERSGKLRSDIAHAQRIVGPLELVLRVVSPYGGLHQRGTRRMPRRPLLSFTEGDRGRALDVVQQHLARAVAAAAARIRSS